MVEQLLVYERDAFLALNGSHTPFWDNFFWIYTGKVVWLPLAAFILFVLVYKKDWRESLLILLAATSSLPASARITSIVSARRTTRTLKIS